MNKNWLCAIKFGITLFSVITVSFFGDFQTILAASNSVDVGQSVFFEGEPPVPPEEDPVGGISLPIDATPPEIFDVNIWNITSNTAKVSWKTDEVSLSELSYGEDKNYYAGKLVDHPDSYEDFNEFSLENLKPATRYYLKLKSRNSGGAEIIITSYSFSTLPEFKLPDNVGSLFARQEGLSVILSWKNPDQNFSGVQINRNVGSFAVNKNEGEVVFMGLAENFVDKSIINNTNYCYTLFSYDSYGNFSSGVSISIKTDFVGHPVPSPDLPGEDIRVPSDVKNLQIIPSVENKNFMLSWNNPGDESGFEIEIRKDRGFPPLTPYEGQLVYKGVAEIFLDTDVQENTVYYYAVFVKSSEKIYSKGKLIAASLKGIVALDIGNEWKRMKFIDVPSGVLLNQNEETVTYLPGRSLGISYTPGYALDDVKSIVVQLDNAFYDLDLNEREGVYQTSFISPLNQGEYTVSVIFLDFNDNVMYQKELKLDIVNAGRVYKEEGKWLSHENYSYENLTCFFSDTFGNHDPACFDKVGVDGAEINVFYKNSQGDWDIWDAEKFNQNNPYITNNGGEFYLFLPDGEYKILVHKPGFEDEEVSVTSVDNLVNVEIRILRSRKYDYALLVLVAIIIIFVVRKRTRKKKMKKIIF